MKIKGNFTYILKRNPKIASQEFRKIPLGNNQESLVRPFSQTRSQIVLLM